MRIRLALLVCDTPIPAVRSVHGDYHNIFHTLLRDALPVGTTSFTLDPFDVVHKQEYPPSDVDYHGIIITGSAADAYRDIEWINKLVAYTANIATMKPQVKIFGICFGHQIVVRAVGGECVPNDGKWEVGVTEVNLTALGKQVFGADTINIQQMHRDHVPSVPPEFHLLGSTPASFNQGMIRFHDISMSPTSFALTDIHILTVQGHPEFTKSISSTLIKARSASGVLSAETAEDARRREDWRNDGVTVIGRVMWGILDVGSL